MVRIPMMPKVVIIAENLLQQAEIRKVLKLESVAELVTANIRQIHPKLLKAFTGADVILIKESSENSAYLMFEPLIALLETLGPPIILLPSNIQPTKGTREPLVLNSTQIDLASPEVIALIDQIKERYVSENGAPLKNGLRANRQPEGSVSPEVLAAWRETGELPKPDDETKMVKAAANPRVAPEQREYLSHKVIHTLTAMGRVSKQLREPLSNMNLAIHMLGQVQSIEERDRYVRLLREEYQRELQLVNELENLHTSLESNL